MKPGRLSPTSLPVNCFFYGFGNTDGSGAGEDYIFCAPQGGRIAITAADPGYTGEQNASGAGDLSYRTNLHFVAIYDPPAGYLALYTNGVLAAVNTSVTVPMSSVNDVAQLHRTLVVQRGSVSRHDPR